MPRLTPADFADIRTAVEALRVVFDSTAASARFPNLRLPWDDDDAEAMRDGLPETLVPFMCEQQQPAALDVYAFHRDAAGHARVVVWSDHAVVADWPDFDAFVQWLTTA
jgi:hypothetical protein